MGPSAPVLPQTMLKLPVLDDHFKEKEKTQQQYYKERIIFFKG